MKQLLSTILLALLLLEPAAAYIFFSSDELDRERNINDALTHPFDGIDLDDAADFDNYNCISLADQRDYADRNELDNTGRLTARDISAEDFKRLRHDDQKGIIDEDAFDRWDDDLLEREGRQQCWTLKDYNTLARKKPRDEFDEVRFKDFDDLRTVQRVGTKRFHFFEPDDFQEFDLQKTRIRRTFYEPYDVRHTPYPRYGYGIRRGDARHY